MNNRRIRHPWQISPYSEYSWLLYFAEGASPFFIASLKSALLRCEDFRDSRLTIVQGAVSLLIVADPDSLTSSRLERIERQLTHILPYIIEEIESQGSEVISSAMSPELKILPLKVGRAYSLDRDRLEKHHRCHFSEILKKIADSTFTVEYIGFAPGFPYCSGLPKEIATPRLAQPHARVDAGAVGIGGDRLGMYPFASPGGWNIIGIMPVPLFTPEDESSPCLLMPGQSFRFDIVEYQW